MTQSSEGDSMLLIRGQEMCVPNLFRAINDAGQIFIDINTMARFAGMCQTDGASLWIEPWTTKAELKFDAERTELTIL